MRRLFFSLTLLLGWLQAAALLADGAPPGQNLITNGDFETPPFFDRGTVAGWTVEGHGHIMELEGEGITSGLYSASFDEGDDSQGNVLYQAFPTVAGQTYILEFDSGIIGQPANSSQLHFEVTGDSSLYDEISGVPTANTTDPSQIEFHHFFRMFTADSSVTTLRFTDIGVGNAYADLVVDTVSVIAQPSPTPAPTPTTLPLVNGNFENWPFNYPGVIADWTVSGNGHIESITEGGTSGPHSAGFSVGGDSFDNVLSQTFFTVPGQVYTLDFDAGVSGITSGNPLQLKAEIVGSSPSFADTITPPDAHTTHPSKVIFDHYHYTFVAGGTTATVQFTDLVGANPGADLMLDTVSILPLPLSFPEWQSLYFTAAEQGNPAISGWSADPDSDGIPNGLEDFFHTDPRSGSAVGQQDLLPKMSLTFNDGSTYLTFSYHRLLGWTGNPPVVAVSDDLVNWDTSQTQIEQVGTPARADGFTEVVTVRLKTPIDQGAIIPRKFLRLQLSQ